MKPIIFILTCAALVLSGCQTVDNRVKEKQAVFDRLDPVVQARLKQGLIEVGYTMDMVYIALGRPSETKETTTAGGTETTWVYLTRYDEYQGTQFAGHRRIVYFDPRVNAYRVHYEPTYANVYAEKVEDKTRVFFKDGKVTAIEQSKQ